MMQRTAVNPWDWSLKLGYNQAEVIEGRSTGELRPDGHAFWPASGGPADDIVGRDPLGHSWPDV